MKLATFGWPVSFERSNTPMRHFNNRKNAIHTDISPESSMKNGHPKVPVNF